MATLARPESVMLRVHEAQSRILARIEPLPGERLWLGEALGRVLLADQRASASLPPEDNSAVDGYALRWDDVQSLGEGGAAPVVLRVGRVIPAGGRPGGELVRGEAARIFTGAPVPPGCDLVVMQENTDRGEAEVRIDRLGGGPGDNLRRAGEDIRCGDVVAPAGRALRAGDLAMLAAQGATQLDVRRRPVVALLSTGDEVHEPGEALPAGHIVSSNSHGLMAQIREAGGIPRYLGIARDKPADLRERLAGLRGSDALITIGGVSVGDFDHVRAVLDELGARADFWKVAMRPGKPNAFGQIAGVPYFGLPGNPVSCMVSFLQFVRPALRRMQGMGDLFLPALDAVAEEALHSKESWLFFLRGVLRQEGGRWFVRTTGAQGSSLLSSMARANGLIVMPEHVGDVPAGALVRVQILPGTLDGSADSGLEGSAG